MIRKLFFIHVYPVVILIMFILFVGCSRLQGKEATTSDLTWTPTSTSIPANIPEPTSTVKPPKDITSLPAISLENVDLLRKLDSYYGHSDGAGVVFSPDGKTLASYSADGTVRLWDLVTGSEFISFSHPPEVMALAFSPDGEKIVSGGSDKMVRLWDISNGVELGVFEGHTQGNGWQSLAWSPDGSLIAAGSCDSVLRVWDVETFTEIVALHDHYYDVTGINFSPDGGLLASASEDERILIWEVDTFTQKFLLSNHSSDVGDVTFSSDGSMIASISGDITEKDNSIRLWDAATGLEIMRMEGHSNSYNGDVSFSPDGSIIISSGGWMNDDRIHLYDVETGLLIASLEGSGNGIVGVAFNPDGSLIASSSNDGIIELWGVE